MNRIHIVAFFIVWCLCEIPTATGEAECAKRIFCLRDKDCFGRFGCRCVNNTCYNTNPCEANWIYSKGSCYLFSTDSTENKDWYEANATCSQYATPGLVEVESADEDNFIKNLLPRHPLTCFWIGGTYWQSLGYFAWSNGNKITEFYWSPSTSPNGPNGCLGYFNGDIGWIDMVCHKDYLCRYICEKSVETEDACGCLPIYSPVCGSDGHDYANKCEADRANVTSAGVNCSI